MVIIGIVILAGVAGYFVVSQRTLAPEPIPSTTLSPTPTPTPPPPASSIPTPSPTPTPVKKLDLRSSLLSVANLHLKDAIAVVAGAKLFEIETSLSPEEINTSNISIWYVFSSFVLPNEDIKYITVNEWFDNPAKRHSETSSRSFIVRVCGGGAPPPPEFRCGEPTGEIESHEKHLPVSNWIIDSKELARILKGNGMGSSRGGKIVVTTIGRLKSKYPAFSPKSIAGLADGQTVIEFIEVGMSSASTNFGDVGQYVILNAKDGKIIAKGNYSLPPPPQ